MSPMLQSFPEEDDRPLPVSTPEQPLPTGLLVLLSLLLFASTAVFAF